MKAPFWKDWDIATRLILIAVLPASLMFVAVTTALYLTGRDDVRRDVAERGRLVANALAQTSQYGLVSGNVSYLQATLQQLLASDPSIAALRITDVDGRALVSAASPVGKGERSQYEVAVRADSLDVDLFDSAGGPHVSLDPRQPVAMETSRIVGHVQVTMTPGPLLQAKRQALLAGSAVVLAFAVLSGYVGLFLAKHLRAPLGAVMTALRSIRQGHYAVELDTTAQGELGELQRTIVQMADSLNVTRQDLERQVAERTQELQQAVDVARDAVAEKRRLIVHNNALLEEERRRIALEIHDQLNATLISVRLEAAALAARTEAQAKEAGQEEAQGRTDIQRLAQRISANTEALYSTARNIVKRLRPEVIDTVGLKGAIEDMVRNFDAVHPDCRFSFRAEPAFPVLRGEAAMPAYRVAQEALSNVVKHARATRAWVDLRSEPDLQAVRLTISDNGCGFDPATARQSGLGLVGMRERMAAVGGEIVIDSFRGGGTRVTITLPVPDRPPT